ncbi:MAG: hypothetical protein ACFFDH_00310 [Promethearchaeota archaeon]
MIYYKLNLENLLGVKQIRPEISNNTLYASLSILGRDPNWKLERPDRGFYVYKGEDIVP